MVGVGAKHRKAAGSAWRDLGVCYVTLPSPVQNNASLCAMRHAASLRAGWLRPNPASPPTTQASKQPTHGTISEHGQAALPSQLGSELKTHRSLKRITRQIAASHEASQTIGLM